MWYKAHLPTKAHVILFRITNGIRMDTEPIELNELIADSGFAEEVKARSGVDLNLCYHCHSCAGGCPFAEAMDFLPNRIIRLVQFGLREQALMSSSIWVCVGCNTCSFQCPNGIDMPAITHTLCQMAIENNTAVAEPDILHFHREVLNTVQRYGRTHKLEIMLRHKLYKRDWTSDLGVGLKMLSRRKLELLPSRVRQMDDIKDLFEKHKAG